MDSRKTVLIVEDERVLREAYSRILAQEGYHIVAAADGREALGRLEECLPDLILLDVLMPHMDGVAFLERAGLGLRCPQVKVVAFSNLSDQRGLDAMMRKGASLQLLKSSLSPRQLADAVRGLLAAETAAA